MLIVGGLNSNSLFRVLSKSIARTRFLRVYCRLTMTTTAISFDNKMDEIPRPIVENGRFKNSWGNSGRPGNFEVFKFLTVYKNDSNVPSQKELDGMPEFMTLTPDYEKINNVSSNELLVTWLGHASVLFQIDGANILSDPVFGKYCGVAQKRLFGTRRFRDCEVEIEKLPKIDAVVISHDHYDHLDSYTIKGLNKRFGMELRWFVPLGTKQWMVETGCKNVIEMNWGDEDVLEIPANCKNPQLKNENLDNKNIQESEDKRYSINTTSLKIVFAPAQHWCTRNIIDENKRLWGSWVIIGPKHRAYFAGDSGYCPTFSIVGNKFGPFDVAAIPIGAYRPRDFMKNQHCDPEEAVKIHQDVKAKKSLAIHWGTFALGYENIREPPRLLEESLKQANIGKDDFFLLKQGETADLTEHSQHS